MYYVETAQTLCMLIIIYNAKIQIYGLFRNQLNRVTFSGHPVFSFCIIYQLLGFVTTNLRKNLIKQQSFMKTSPKNKSEASNLCANTYLMTNSFLNSPSASALKLLISERGTYMISKNDDFFVK